MVVCLCALLQFRIQYHDAYTSLNGMYQLLGILIFGSLTAFAVYMRSEKKHYLFLSLLLYLAAHLLSEVGLAALVFIPIVAWVLHTPIPKIMKRTLPFLVVSGLYLAIVAWLKVNVADSSAVYSGLQANFAPRAMWHLFAKQMFATLPLSNLYGQFALPEILLHRADLMPFTVLLVVLLIFGILFLSFRSNRFWGAKMERRMLVFFVLLAIVPALFILPSHKYQIEVQRGVGYLPIYLQSFGAASLLAWIIAYWMSCRTFIKRVFAYGISTILAAAVVITFLFNAALINARMYELSTPVIAQYNSLKDGLLNEVPEGSAVVVSYFWNMAWVYDEVIRHLYHKKINVFNAYDMPPSTADLPQSWYELETLPGTTVHTRLYKWKSETHERGQLLQERTHYCGLQQTENEKYILHRIF